MNEAKPQAATIDVGAVLTEPMRVRQLAYYFSVEPHKMRRMLGVIPGATKIGGLWRVPVVAMTPRYLLSRGLVQPTKFPVDGTKWN